MRSGVREWQRAVGHAWRLLWRQSAAWIAVLVVGGLAIVRGYLSAYPTLAQRMLLAEQIAHNPGFAALNGQPHRLETLGGFVAWRLGGPYVVLTAAWGLLAVTKLLRGEEDAGHTELVLAGRIGARGLTSAGLTALGGAFAVAWAALGTTMAAAGVPARGAFVIALASMLGAVLFTAVGALASQLWPSRRQAATWAGASLGLAFLLRVGADGTRTLGWLRWTTPLGWIENLRPFDGTRVAALLPVGLLTIVALAGAFALAARRDLGDGVFSATDTGRTSSRLLSGVAGLAFLTGRVAIFAWSFAIGAYALLFGLLAKDMAKLVRISEAFRKFAGEFGATLGRPSGFLGVMFASFLVLPVVLYVVTQVAALREEEASGRLDNVIVRPVGRRRWLASRVAVTLAGAVFVALVTGLLAWIGAALQGAGVSFGGMLAGALNLLPAAALFCGLGVTFLAFVPRLTAPLTVGVVVTAYLIELIGALVNAPRWVLDLSPFHHVAPSPAVAVNGGAALVMVALGAVGLVLGAEGLARRDVTGA